MGKKNKFKKAKFRGAMDTLSRLATTVKADAPTLILASKETPSGTLKNDGLYVSPFQMAEAKPKNRLSQFASRLVPFKRSPMQSWRDRKAAKKLKKLARQMASHGNSNMLKVRRSRLPLVIALLVVAMGFGGYYMFKSVTLPQVNVTKVIDYKSWLDTTSGNVQRSEPKVVSSSKSSYSQSKVTRSYKVNSKGNHVSKATAKKSHKSKAKLSKAKKSGKAKLVKAKGKKGYKKTSHKK